MISRPWSAGQTIAAKSRPPRTIRQARRIGHDAIVIPHGTECCMYTGHIIERRCPAEGAPADECERPAAVARENAVKPGKDYDEQRPPMAVSVDAPERSPNQAAHTERFVCSIRF